jgi:hypothetical protein
VALHLALALHLDVESLAQESLKHLQEQKDVMLSHVMAQPFE